MKDVAIDKVILTSLPFFPLNVFTLGLVSLTESQTREESKYRPNFNLISASLAEAFLFSSSVRKLRP